MNIKNKIVFCRLVQVAHPNVLVLVEHIARELNFAEYLVSRANKGKKCRAPVRSHYQTLKKDTERLQEMYLKGEVLGGTMGYLKQMGYLSHRVQEESKRLKGITRKIEDDIENIPEAAAQAVDIPGAASQYVPQGDYPGRANKDRLQEMRAQGFGENSFVNKNSPYRNRVNGVTARGQAATENMDNQKNYDLRNKKCLKCQKKFLNGILKKSKVIQCNGCGGFVHEKSSTGCKVNLSRGSLQFYCPSCANFAVTVREKNHPRSPQDLNLHWPITPHPCGSLK